MTKSAMEQIWKDYLDAYANVSPEERNRLLRQSVSDDVESSNPADEAKGFDNLVAHIEQFQQRLPGSYFKNNKLLVHHGQLLSEWTLYKSDDSAVTTAHTYARFNEQGRLTHLTGFF
jgi:hypothetical protein